MTYLKYSSHLLAATYLLHITASYAGLVDRGNGMIYDEEQDITWLQDINYIITSGYANGMVTWEVANEWAEQLVYGGFDDWRLPSTPQQDPTCINVPTDDHLTYRDCIGGELGYLYYVHLGNEFEVSYSNYLGNNYAPFIDGSGSFANVFPTKGIWTSTEFDPSLDWPQGVGIVPQTAGYYWLFYANWGSKFVFRGTNYRYATAVRDGDVLPPSLPGDINFDNQVDLADYLMLMRFVLQTGPAPSTTEFEAGDMNQNDQLDAGDIVIHSRIILGLI